MGDSTYTGEGFTLELTQDAIPFTSLGHYELDPKWSFTDPNGHVHTSLETLEWIVTSTYWCEDCNDEHDEGEYRCRVCGEAVEPRYIWKDTSMFTQYIPGLQEGRLRMADGRTFWLRGDDFKIPWTAEGPSPEWIERITQRQPEEWTVAAMRGR